MTIGEPYSANEPNKANAQDRAASSDLAAKVYGRRVAEMLRDGRIVTHHFLCAMQEHRLNERQNVLDNTKFNIARERIGESDGRFNDAETDVWNAAIDHILNMALFSHGKIRTCCSKHSNIKKEIQ